MNLLSLKKCCKSILLASGLIFILSCGDDENCGKALISFNNKTSSTIFIRVPGETNGYESVAPGSALTLFDLTPGQEINYFITSGAQGSGEVLGSGTEVAEDCVSLGIDIK